MSSPAERSLVVHPGGPVSGTLRVPGDKSLSHRSVIFGSLARGTTEVQGLLEGEDVLRTLAAFRSMGVAMERPAPGHYRIHGSGLEGLTEPDTVLDLGNSGTAIRLLTGLLSGLPFHAVVTGDDSLRRRPMGRVVEPLRRMGARIDGRQGGQLAPLSIRGVDLLPLDYASPIASAQVKTALLLAGLTAPGVTSVSEPRMSRDHTERMLAAFGGEVVRDGLRVSVAGWCDLQAQRLTVPGDISSAAFPLVAALVTPGSLLRIEGVGVNPTRTGLLDLLLAMGGDIRRENERMEGGEPVADLVVCHSSLRGIEVPPEVVPRAIDEFPIFFVAAALAEGVTVARGLEELRVKESDRIHAMAVELAKVGAVLEELEDGMRLEGRPEGLTSAGVLVDSHTDHRIAMSLLVAGLRGNGPLTVSRTENIDTSFPGFADLMGGAGARIVAA
ncbi:MAG: 3-phosphoshikimate 1-carboxyvinyltransferase [Magnetococcus sp. WYHC-3]